TTANPTLINRPFGMNDSAIKVPIAKYQENGDSDGVNNERTKKRLPMPVIPEARAFETFMIFYLQVLKYVARKIMLSGI
ncbi:MAG: hypothetical protein ACPGQF_06520, partial [Akkermansiaceae bacterium]